MNEREFELIQYEIASWALLVIGFVSGIGANILSRQDAVAPAFLAAVSAVVTLSWAVAITTDGYNRRFWQSNPFNRFQKLDDLEATFEDGDPA